MSGEDVPLLSLTAVSMTIGGGRVPEVAVLASMSLSVRAGDFVCLAGRSGSGKTTALRIAHGQVRPSTGAVSWSGVELNYGDEKGLSRRRNAHTGFVDQASTLLPGISLLENVLLPAVPTNSVNRLRRRARLTLHDLGIGERMDHRPSALSGGEAQRGALARAFLMDPPLIIADEPTANLDEANALNTIRLLRQHVSRGGGVLIASHDELVMNAADRVFRLAPTEVG